MICLPGRARLDSPPYHSVFRDRVPDRFCSKRYRAGLDFGLVCSGWILRHGLARFSGWDQMSHASSSTFEKSISAPGGPRRVVGGGVAMRVVGINAYPYRCASLIRNSPLLGPHSRTVSKNLLWP